ncbi:MAG: phosphopantetheine-binding protein, partial [Planctomycetota bacterium]
LEPSIFFGDATCPRCGQLIWFFKSAGGFRIFPRHDQMDLHDRILSRISEQLNVPRSRIINNPRLINEIGADSLDTIELVLELEEEFDT